MISHIRQTPKSKLYSVYLYGVRDYWLDRRQYITARFSVEEESEWLSWWDVDEYVKSFTRKP